MNLEEAKQLKYGDIIYHKTAINADGSKQRFKVNGKVKTWKKNPSRIHIPLKRGLYEYGYLDEYDLEEFSLTKE